MNFFNMLGALGNMGKIKQEVENVQRELADLSFEGKAGGGMVTVKVNGAQQLTACSIDPQVFADNDRELLEDLVVAAVNQAVSQSRKESFEQFQKRLGERLNLPDLPSLLSGFAPKS